jgi:subtilisin family serine protease
MHRDRWHLAISPLLAAVLGSSLTVAVLAGDPEFLAARGAAAVHDSTPKSAVSPFSADPLEERLQHLARLGVDRWHAAGYRGRGIKIAILDTGFHGYHAYLGRALPETVTVRSFRADRNLEAKDSQHGILCGEVIHALAPDAELLLANWEPDRSDQFLEAVRWARQQGARILSCSLIMPSWSDGEGGGAVHAALARLLGNGSEAGDLLCFASAGNTAQRHWSGVFLDAGNGLHEWQSGKEANDLLPWSDAKVSVEVCWRTQGDYDLCVHDQTAKADVAESLAKKGFDRCSAVARFLPEAGHRYAVRIRLAHGPAGMFHLVALGASLQYATASGSIPFPADGPAVIAVGAVGADGHRMSYSSCGPNSTRPKPDLVAPVPFTSLWRARPFSGTSASAPQAAALAALWWSRYSNWTASQVRTALCSSARDLGPPGHDYETGYGLIALP